MKSYAQTQSSFPSQLLTALEIAGGVSIMTLSLVMPNAIQILRLYKQLKRSVKRSIAQSQKQSNLAREVRQAFYYMKNHGYIRMRPVGLHDYVISFTKLGKKRLSKIKFDNLQIEKTKKWDGQWWLIAGDIPTKTHRHGADLLRAKFRQMGLYTLQRTLWLYPYDPRTALQYILDEYSLEHYVTVMQVSRLDRDDEENAKKHFHKLGVL